MVVDLSFRVDPIFRSTCRPLTMKLNVANPATGAQKLFDFENERDVRVFMDKRMGQEVPADSLGDEWKG